MTAMAKEYNKKAIGINFVSATVNDNYFVPSSSLFPFLGRVSSLVTKIIALLDPFPVFSLKGAQKNLCLNTEEKSKCKNFDSENLHAINLEVVNFGMKAISSQTFVIEVPESWKIHEISQNDVPTTLESNMANHFHNFRPEIQLHFTQKTLQFRAF